MLVTTGNRPLLEHNLELCSLNTNSKTLTYIFTKIRKFWIMSNHAFSSLLVLFHWSVCPPLNAKIAILIIHSTYKNTNKSVWQHAGISIFSYFLKFNDALLFFKLPELSKACESSCPTTAPIPPKLIALIKKGIGSNTKLKKKCFSNVDLDKLGKYNHWAIENSWEQDR